MIASPAQISRHHLANLSAPNYLLIRKVCACGKVSIIKLLTQHGKCTGCALAYGGLATTNNESETPAYFHSTRLGCKAASLDAAGIKRTMEYH